MLELSLATQRLESSVEVAYDTWVLDAHQPGSGDAVHTRGLVARSSHGRVCSYTDMRRRYGFTWMLHKSVVVVVVYAEASARDMERWCLCSGWTCSVNSGFRTFPTPCLFRCVLRREALLHCLRRCRLFCNDAVHSFFLPRNQLAVIVIGCARHSPLRDLTDAPPPGSDSSESGSGLPAKPDISGHRQQRQILSRPRPLPHPPCTTPYRAPLRLRPQQFHPSPSHVDTPSHRLRLDAPSSKLASD